MTGRIAIDDISPDIQGAWSAKAVVGEVIPVRAVVWREGHDALGATLVTVAPDGTELRTHMEPALEPDVFNAVFRPSVEGQWHFRIEAWGDPLATWRHGVEKKLGAGQSLAELANDLELGARLFDRALEQTNDNKQAHHKNQARLETAAKALRSDRPLAGRVTVAFSNEVSDILREHPLRDLITQGESKSLTVERRRALFGSWYEFFPRSTGGWDEDGNPVHGNFTTALDELPRVAAMGFDVVYLPPIHPIGKINRKGPNNTLTPGPTDPGSPWAIGSADGGHDAIHPELGTVKDFKKFVAHARKLGLEIALDLALQCAPDHPWAQAHPEWFTVLPDGTIAYAENPPKKYQDIYPLNFDNDRDGLYAECLRVVNHWISLGVKIFRVDNPHTKPADFWAWLIAEVRKEHPDVLWLSEAFTRPARMYGLGRRGFSQSYTYFTWRVWKHELAEFAVEIARKSDESRPNLFVNTPDILHASLQYGGKAMFAIRAALAATMAPTWGVYSGFELFEGKAVSEGSEEYLDSEKYELRPRDYPGAKSRGESLEPWITRLNNIRRNHPALQQLRVIHLHSIENENIIAYSKIDPVTGDCVLTIINLNPNGEETGTIWLDMPAIGRDWHDRFEVYDEVSGETYDWGQANWVKLSPWKAVAHILVLPAVAHDSRIERAYR